MIINIGDLRVCHEYLDGLGHPSPSPIIAFCSGSFDLFHAGHVLFLEECKRFANYLFVGVGSDNAVRANKGQNRPIMNEDIRMKLVDSCRPVDFTFLENITTEPGNVNRMLNIVFDMLQPSRYIVNSDAVEMDSRRDACRDMGVSLSILDRVCPSEYDSISTSKLIEKILRLGQRSAT